LKEWGSVEKPADRFQRDVFVTGEAAAVMKVNEAFPAKMTGVAGEALTAKMSTGSIRRDDGGWERGSIEARDQCRAIREIKTEIGLGTGVVIEVIGNAKGGRLEVLGEPAHMPQVIETITSGSHGTTIHVSTKSSRLTKEWFS